VIAGQHDAVSPPILAERRAERLPNAGLASLGTGHASYLERPDEWLELAAEFLERGSEGCRQNRNGNR
jgi:pimeloyl-ACP methyl ester carboxylesterase